MTAVLAMLLTALPAQPSPPSRRRLPASSIREPGADVEGQRVSPWQ